MNKTTTLDMTEGKVIRVLLVFTIPIFISNLFQKFYNVVDVAVIEHILGDNVLAAVGATSSIYSLVIGFINGMSNGFCIIIARYFGGNEQDDFQKSVQFAGAFLLPRMIGYLGICLTEPITWIVLAGFV